jgi:hypothetical protein
MKEDSAIEVRTFWASRYAPSRSVSEASTTNSSPP